MSEKNVSRRSVVKLVGAAAAGLAVGGVGGWLGRESMIPTQAVKPALSGDITIGVIHADPSEAGPVQPALDIAVDQVNTFCEQAGLDVKFLCRVEGAEGTPTKALERFNALIGAGIQFVIAPQWSGMVSVLLPPANTNKVVIVSGGSSSPGLSIADDYLFRTSPDDLLSSVFFSSLTTKMGIKAIICSYDTDSFGLGCWQANQKRWTDSGLTFVKGIPRDPLKSEYIGEVATADQYYKDALAAGYKPSEVMIDSVGAKHLQWVTSMAKYPDLMGGPGVGPWVFDYDGAGAPDIVQFAADAASQVEYSAFTYSPTASEKWIAVGDQYQKKTGFPFVFGDSLTGFDAFWIGALSILLAGNSGPAIQKILPSVAYNYFGVTGWCALNDAGDRKFADYSLQKVVKENGVVKWVTYGHYDGASNTITYSGPYAPKS